MKKIMLTILFAILVSIVPPNVNAEINVDWNFGNVGFGINYSAQKEDNIEITASVFNLIIEENVTNVGLELNPIKYWHLFELQDAMHTKTNGNKFSFINVNMYWNIPGRKNILFGPFASANYMYVNTLTGFNANELVLSSGLRFSYKLSGSSVLTEYKNNYQIVSSEIGYRNLLGENKFYFSVNIDILLALYSIGTGMRTRSPAESH
ncbi:MAG: hypothetical protein Ta2A_24820 [Treponemataceae bacterium]|nr:MAG: hypothetical protein Ta2A_24820 [Treponemataceae bacterium]